MQRVDEQPPGRAGKWGLRLAIFAVTLVLATSVFHRLFHMPTPVALNLFMVSFAIAGLAILCALVALYATWRTGRRGAATAFGAVVIAGALFAWPLYLLPTVLSLPLLHDISTDTQNPPAFTRLAVLRPKGANDANWPGARAAAEQKVAYPDIAPLFLARGPEDSFELVLEALRRLKMAVAAETRDNAGGGAIEAVDQTFIFGFQDDLVVRVTADKVGSRVDVRSASRYGRHDLGRNVERVRRVLNQIVARAQATVPTTPGERVVRSSAQSRAGRAGADRGTTARATRSQNRRARQRRQAPD